jgi:hypothetical protein
MSSERPGASLRQQVSARAKDCCEYCFSQRRFSSVPFSVEHIIPRSGGGLTESANLALACQGCNNYKYNHVSAVDPVSGRNVALFHPRNDIWSQHFAWAYGFAEIVGLTARGRATVARLRLNRADVIALRRILALISLHPPDYPFSRLNA